MHDQTLNSLANSAETQRAPFGTPSERASSGGLRVSRGMARPLLSGLLLSGFLGACSTLGLQGEPSPATPEPAPPAPVVVTPPVLQQPVIAADSSKLMAMRPADVQQLLGTPTLLTRDGNVQVALYEVDTCVLDLTFFASSITSPFRVTHLSARTPLGDPASSDDCLSAILPDGAIPLALQIKLPASSAPQPSIQQAAATSDVRQTATGEPEPTSAPNSAPNSAPSDKK